MIFTLEPPGIDPLDVSISATRARTEHLRNLTLILCAVIGLMSTFAAFVGWHIMATLLAFVGIGVSGLCIGFSSAAYDIALCDIYADIGGRRVR